MCGNGTAWKSASGAAFKSAVIFIVVTCLAVTGLESGSAAVQRVVIHVSISLIHTVCLQPHCTAKTVYCFK